MKRLYLLRHSKAGHTNKKILDDHERTLTGKGETFCKDIAKYLEKEAEPLPQKVLCSTAERAKQTNELVLEHLGEKIPTKMMGSLYLAAPRDILDAIRKVEDKTSSLLVVGHNPGLQEFAILLAGKGDKQKFRKMRSNFPPPSVAAFDIDVDRWSQVKERSGELVDFFTAKKERK